MKLNAFTLIQLLVVVAIIGILAYMDENVSQKASELGRQQNPSLAGDPNKVLMSYR